MELDLLNDQESSSGSMVLESSTNATLICAAASLESANFTILPHSVYISSRVLQSLYGLVMLIFGLVLNSLLLYLVLKYKKLQTVSFAIAIQIAIANLLLSVIFGLPTVINNIVGHWVLGLEICILSAFIGFLVANLRMLLIVIFSVDRFASVFVPFSYPKYSCKIVAILSILAWITTCVLSLLMMPKLLDCYIFSQSAMFCFFSFRCENCLIVLTIYLVTIFIPAVFIPTVIFMALYIKGRIIRRKQAKLATLPENVVFDWRAIKTLSFVFIAIVVVTVFPLVIFQLSKLFGPVTQTLIITLSSDIGFILIITDPIMILRNRDVKEVLSEISWKRSKQCQK